MKVKVLIYVILGAMILAVSSCSTTRRLEEGQILYTGVRRTTIESMTGDRVPGAVESMIREPLNVRPNNPLYSPYLRTPIPTGLWAWNYLYTDRTSGFRAWLYRRLAKEPVLIEHVKPDTRVNFVLNLLDNSGYFGSTGGFELLPRRNPKKARLSYHFEVNEPWTYSRVQFPLQSDDISMQIRSMQPTSGLRPGVQYNIDSMIFERIRITNQLRDRSYYYFRPEYIGFLADTSQQRLNVDLKMVLAQGIPVAALRAYNVGDVKVLLQSSYRQREADSMEYNGIRILYHKPLKIRPKVLRESLTIEPGQPIRVSEINRTLDNLVKLGIFRYVNMEVTPLDSIGGRDAIDMNIVAAFEAPMQVEMEADFATKSNSFIGPGVSFDVRHNNIFRGGEVLSVRANASYEWQTGNKRAEANATAVNSYEFGLNTSLIFPRVVPQFVPVGRRYGGRTMFNLGWNILNRPKFFTMLSVNFSAGYDFQTSIQSQHNWTVFRLVYNDLLRTTSDFDNTMAENPAIARSFQSQFIPSMSYTYTLDRRFANGRNRIVWQSTVIEAGNILSAMYELSGRGGSDKQLFGRHFSQFVKLTSELRFFHDFNDKLTLATRFMAGAGFAYGNSDVLPYSEQFFIGGANSIRAFTIRSLGPGSYRPYTSNRYGYFDQTGDLKIEANAELRFNILGGLNGAVFLDAGNIFLIEEDPDRPGGHIGSGDFWSKIALGTGVGLRYDLSFLVIRADLGIGLHVPYETERNGYYNIPTFKDGLGFHLAIGYPF